MILLPAGSTMCTIFYTQDGVIEDSEGHKVKAISVRNIKEVSGYANYTCPGKGHPEVWPFLYFSICCFWHPCPLYAVCNKVYVPDVADYEPRNDNPGLDAMPGEPIGNSYYPNIVIHERW
ncbi:hypothetical protein CEXT_522041 [Caerostris extrusa]|uniref:Uncharacterized protein n=1 Tax=Caerostris extrusa TaxID=172846 RepID=A0AAV4UV46_CAEEX|nr:hypothetical protein CEXT_522041 [Caerostris extrusa]